MTFRLVDLPPEVRQRMNLSIPTKPPRAKRGTGKHSVGKAKRLALIAPVMRDGVLTFTLPIRAVNSLNGSHGHWSATAARRKEHRAMARQMMPRELPALPISVQLTRIAPRNLDAWDALPASLKSVIDGIADAYGLRDDDARFTWLKPNQEKGEYGVRVEIRTVAK